MSEVISEIHFTKSLLYARDYESSGKAPSSMTPRGTSLESWRPLKEDIRRKPGKNVGIPQVGDAGDRAALNATIATDHLSRILRGFQWSQLRKAARILRELGPGFQWGKFAEYENFRRTMNIWITNKILLTTLVRPLDELFDLITETYGLAENQELMLIDQETRKGITAETKLEGGDFTLWEVHGRIPMNGFAYPGDPEDQIYQVQGVRVCDIERFIANCVGPSVTSRSSGKE
jgi:hypothetical protein